MKKYWMVHRKGGGSPNKNHNDYQSANNEALRLAKRNPDVKFAILEAVEYVICKLPEPTTSPIYDIGSEKGDTDE